MENDVDCVRLAKQAQLGEKESLEQLAKLAEESLRSDVYRMTMQRDLTEDIVQETILEMLRMLGKLREPDRFWPWLYKIALNKIRLHHRTKKRRSDVPISAMPDLQEQKEGQEAMSNLVADELKQIVFKAMWQLKPQYRVVLILRCYKEMDYPAIAESMGRSEFAVRKLFWRAKKSLQRQLARQGLGRGSLLMALVLFGKITAPTEAAAASVSVTAATTKVGVTAGLVGLVASKATVVSLVAAGALGIGAIVVTSEPDQTTGLPGQKHATSQLARQVGRAEKVAEEYLYFFPQGTDAPVMMRAMKSDSKGKRYFCEWMQDEKANYLFDKRSATLRVNNYRQWDTDLSVWRLPTDSADLRGFLSHVEGKSKSDEFEYVSSDTPGLIAVVRRNEKGDFLSTARHCQLLNEEYFRYSWPSGVKVVDNRDAMHERGWTYFRITGQINGERISGTGRIPFVYATSRRYYPWLRLNVGQRLRIVDDGDQAIVRRTGKVVAGFESGSLFKGLARPWMGLHTIDTVRRDAAEQRVWFQTKYQPKDEKAEVELTCEQGKVVYTVDMQKDVVNKIAFSMNDGRKAELRFSYLQDIEEAGDEFIEPRMRRSQPSRQRASPGMLWLVRLADGNLIQ